MNYYLCEKKTNGVNATSKARNDFASIMGSMEGWLPLEVHSCWDINRGIYDKASALVTTWRDWRAISRIVGFEDILVVPYPLATQPKVATTVIPLISRVKSKGAKVILFIHDLDSVRWQGVYNNDRSYVDLADAVVVHNESMGNLVEGWTSSPVIRLGVFDYLYDGLPSPYERGIDVAGNLSPEKSRWIYKVIDSIPAIPLNLFGAGYTNEKSSANISYRGAFPADELPSKLTGLFGLVWDGDSVDTCAGPYGEYLRINSPHKLSLYLAVGKPVIIWSEAAEAPFVKENGVGIAVDNIQQAFDAYRSMNEIDLDRYQKNAQSISRLITSGYFTKCAISEAVDALRRTM